MSLTYRQTAAIYERYWERKVWEIEVGVVTNPMASFDDDKKETGVTPLNNDVIDATTDEGISQLIKAGLPVKRM